MWRDKADPNAVDPATAVVESDTRLQLAQKVRLAIRHLPPQQARAMTLTYLEELTYAQTAQRMGRTENTVKTQIRNAKQRLAMLLTADDEELKELWECMDRGWLIRGWLPANTVTLFTGDSGAGQSWLTLQVVSQVACGFNNAFLDPEFKMPSKAKNESKHIVFATYEDEPAEIQRRLQALASSFGWIKDSLKTIKKHLLLVDMRGVGSVWGPGIGKHIANTGDILFAGEAIRTICEERNAKLLIMDPLSSAFGGNANDPTAVHDFLSSFRGWGDAAKCATLLVGHLPKSAEGKAAGLSGSTAWEASARSMWMLSKQNAGDSKDWALLHTKSNDAPLQKEKPLVKSPYGWWREDSDSEEAVDPGKD